MVNRTWPKPDRIGRFALCCMALRLFSNLRPITDQGPTGPRLILVWPRPRAVLCNGRRVNQPAQVCLAIILAAVQQLVFEQAVAAAMGDHVLKLDQAREMDFQLRIAPTRRRAYFAPRKTQRFARLVPGLAFMPHPIHQERQQAPRLRRQLIERAAQHVMRDAVRRAEIEGDGRENRPRTAKKETSSHHASNSRKKAGARPAGGSSDDPTISPA